MAEYLNIKNILNSYHIFLTITLFVEYCLNYSFEQTQYWLHYFTSN